jgi:RNA polymerase sigma factor (TIGR02999 family)
MERTAGTTSSLTVLLQAWRKGDTAARDQFFTLVYDELHRTAQRFIRHERAGHTLQASALVNEAYLRLIDANQVQWQDRAHFFGIAAHFMRRILVDAARRKGVAKRGGGTHRRTFDEALVVGPELSPDLVSLDDALEALAKVDARKSNVVELRFFGGLTVDETAEVLKVSPQTVLRDWSLAKVWLLRELERGQDHES